MRPSLPAPLHADLHEPADPVKVDHLERVLADDVVLRVVADEGTVIVPAHAQTGLGQVVGAEAEEFRRGRGLVRPDRRPGEFDDAADKVTPLYPRLRERLFAPTAD